MKLMGKFWKLLIKKLLIFVLIFSILFTSCTSMKMIRKENQTEFYNEINKACKERKVEMKLLNGQKFQVYNLRVSADSTIWQDVKYYKKQSILTNEIAEIKRIKRGKGALQGFLIGYLPIFSAVFILVILDPGKCEPPGECALYLSSILGAPGGILGMIIGAGIGAKDRYILQ